MFSSTAKHDALHWVLEKIAAAKKKAPAKSNFVVRAPTPIGITPLRPINSTKTPEQKKIDLLHTRDKELELWKQWQVGGQKPKDLDPLYNSMKGLIESRSRIYKNQVEIPTAAIDFEHKQRFAEALKSYDPKKGKLSSWVTTYLKKAGRFVTEHQNVARITENIAKNIGMFNSIKADLTEKLGYEPDTDSLAEATGLSKKEVIRLNREQRKAFITTAGGPEGSEFAAPVNLSDREWEVIKLIYHQLSPQERIVHEYTFGLNGRPQLKPGQIARKLKMDGSKVAKIRTSIYNKMQPHLGT